MSILTHADVALLQAFRATHSGPIPDQLTSAELDDMEAFAASLPIPYVVTLKADVDGLLKALLTRRGDDHVRAPRVAIGRTSVGFIAAAVCWLDPGDRKTIKSLDTFSLTMPALLAQLPPLLFTAACQAIGVLTPKTIG
jgi:hypothetical protein